MEVNGMSIIGILNEPHPGTLALHPADIIGRRLLNRELVSAVKGSGGHSMPGVDFFDKTLYGEEISHTSETEEELRDETNPNEYEENKNKIEYMDKKEDLKEVTTDEEEFRKWDGIDEDWQEFNKKNNEEGSK